MSTGNTNNIVAKELSDAMARCKQKGVDEQSLRTGLLTITIANFVNRIGMENTTALFAELPSQIMSGIFDRYIDPSTNTPRSPALKPQYAQQQQQVPEPQGSYQNAILPQSFVHPYAAQQVPQTAPSAYVQAPLSQPHTSEVARQHEKRRLAE